MVEIHGTSVSSGNEALCLEILGTHTCTLYTRLTYAMLWDSSEICMKDTTVHVHMYKGQKPLYKGHLCACLKETSV